MSEFNLLPEAYLERFVLSRQLNVAIGVALLCAVLLFAWFGYLKYGISKVAQQVDEQKLQQRRIDLDNQYLADLSGRLNRIQQLQSLVRSKDGVGRLIITTQTIAAKGNNQNVWLSDLKFSVVGENTANNKSATNRFTVTIDGFIPKHDQLSAYLNSFKSTDAFNQVELASSNLTDFNGHQVVRFVAKISGEATH